MQEKNLKKGDIKSAPINITKKLQYAIIYMIINLL